VTDDKALKIWYAGRKYLTNDNWKDIWKFVSPATGLTAFEASCVETLKKMAVTIEKEVEDDHQTVFNIMQGFLESRALKPALSMLHQSHDLLSAQDYSSVLNHLLGEMEVRLVKKEYERLLVRLDEEKLFVGAPPAQLP